MPEGLEGSRERGNALVHQLSAAQPELCLFQLHLASRLLNPLIWDAELLPYRHCSLHICWKPRSKIKAWSLPHNCQPSLFPFSQLPCEMMAEVGRGMVGHSPELRDLGKRTRSSPAHTGAGTRLGSHRPGALGTCGLPACSSRSQAGLQLLPAPGVWLVSGDVGQDAAKPSSPNPSGTHPLGPHLLFGGSLRACRRGSTLQKLSFLVSPLVRRHSSPLLRRFKHPGLMWNAVPVDGEMLELCALSWLPFHCCHLIIEESAAGKLIHPKSRLSASCAGPSSSPTLDMG